MNIEITPFQEKYLSDVVEMYNSLITTIPFNWPVSGEEFHEEVLFNSKFPFHPEEFLIAIVDGNPVGFVHIGMLKASDSEETRKAGIIRFLFFPEQSPVVGQQLLNSAVRSLKKRGLIEIFAWRMYEGYPFYTARHGGCWEGSYIAEFFLKEGFEICRREIFFARVLAVLPDIENPKIDFRCEKSEERIESGTISCSYTIKVNDDEAGSCGWYRMDKDSRHQDARYYGYIDGIGVSESYRRQGIGTYMMQCMLHDMTAHSIREVALHTMFDNLPAIGLYRKSGFRQKGTMIVFRMSNLVVS